MLTVALACGDPRSAAELHGPLSAAGYRVHVETSAEGTAELLRRTPAHLVIADQAVRGTGGVELCRRLRAGWAHARRPPHFVVLADDDPQPLQRASDAGVDDLLFKPLRSGELPARVRAWTQLLRAQEQLSDERLVSARLRGELAAVHADLAVAQTRLADRATRDDLTGLPNRRAALRQLEEAFAAARADGRPLACAVADVDGFRRWNEVYGQASGDRVLWQVARVLRTCLPPDAACRLSSDEFLLLFPGRTAVEATVISERCRAALLTPPARHDGEPQRVTISIGVAELTPRTPGAEDLLHDADAALHHAKRAGRDRVAMAA